MVEKVKFVLSVFIAVFLFIIKGYSSDSTYLRSKNLLFATFGGSENFGSVNYERIVSTGKIVNLSFSVGIQPFGLNEKFSLPVSVNAFTSGRAHHFEIDLTSTFYMDKFHPYTSVPGFYEDYNKQLYISPFVCYRFQNSSRFVGKVGAGPQILIDPPSENFINTHTQILRPSIFGSLGWSF